jgi:outer membrane protein W
MFTPYLGVGYNSTKTTFNVDGNYNIAGLAIDVSDLTKIDFESNNNFRANIGFRFNIAVLALQANYTFSEYPTATLGAGISLR